MKQNVNQLLNIKPVDLNKMSFNELRKTVSIMASAANKRLKRLRQAGLSEMSPAYAYAEKRAYSGRAGGKFGVAGKNINQLRNEYAAIRGFMKQKSSSVSGYKKMRSETYKRIGGDFSDFEDPKATERDFWKTYRKLEEMHPELASMRYGSDELLTDLRRVTTRKKNNGDVLTEMEQIINDEYEKEQFESADDFSDFW